MQPIRQRPARRFIFSGIDGASDMHRQVRLAGGKYLSADHLSSPTEPIRQDVINTFDTVSAPK